MLPYAIIIGICTIGFVNCWILCLCKIAGNSDNTPRNEPLKATSSFGESPPIESEY